MASFFFAASTLSALAHHSFANVFDADQPLILHGAIVEIRFENPHSWFFLNVKSANGKIEKWQFEGPPPTSLLRIGIKPGLIKQGDQVTIKGWRARDASQRLGFAREVGLSDGRVFAVGPAVAPSPQ